MMTPQGLQINSPDDSFTRLRVFTDSIVCVYIVFRVRIADCRSVPVRVKSITNLVLLHELPQLRPGVYDRRKVVTRATARIQPFEQTVLGPSPVGAGTLR